MQMSREMDFSAGVGDDEVIAAIVRRLKADSGTIHLVGTDGQLHLQAATPGFPEVVLATIRTIPVGKGMAGLAAQRRRPVDACNIQTDTSGDVRPGARATALSGAIVVPIFRGDAVIGTLGVGNRSERVFTQGEVDDLLAAGRALSQRYLQAVAI
jgi:signal transduction protein with GAF and PtsI domain